MFGLLPYHKFEVRLDSPFGKGNFATADILEGEILCKMTGPIMSTRDHIEKYGSLQFSHPLQIAKDSYFDLIEPYVFFNHSCNPNAGIRNNGVVFALRPIIKGAEIFYDYSTTSDEIAWQMECECKEMNCRKIITDFLSIPHIQKQYYLEKNALTEHIRSVYY
jgi:hypothetical protein